MRSRAPLGVRAKIGASLAAQGACMARMLRDPRGLAPWDNATGVSLYVLGMMAMLNLGISIEGMNIKQLSFHLVKQ